MLMRCMTSSALIYTAQKGWLNPQKTGVTGPSSTTFPRLYKVIKLICSALWAISRTQMTDFPTLLNTSGSTIPTLSYSWSLKKVPLSGGAFPYRTLKGVPTPRDNLYTTTPPPPPAEDNLYSVSSAEEAQKLIDDFETRNTVKYSCYMASRGFGGTGEK